MKTGPMNSFIGFTKPKWPEIRHTLWPASSAAVPRGWCNTTRIVRTKRWPWQCLPKAIGVVAGVCPTKPCLGSMAKDGGGGGSEVMGKLTGKEKGVMSAKRLWATRLVWKRCVQKSGGCILARCWWANCMNRTWAISERPNIVTKNEAGWVLLFRLATLASTTTPNQTVTHVMRTTVTHVVRTPNPAPYNLKYLEIGNENGGSYYAARYTLFYDAIKAHYSNI